MKGNQTKISIIASLSENKAIGKDNKLLWHIPEDLKRFKKITLGHPIIMGKNTHISIGRVLPGRANIVVAKEKSYKSSGCLVFNSFEDAIEKAKAMDAEEIFIIGGGMIYEQGIKIADKLYITLVKGEFEADTFFPEYSQFNKVIYRKNRKVNKYDYTFLELERDKKAVETSLI